MHVLVMLPTGTRDEADQARRAFAAHGLGVHFAWAVAHTRGQTIRGDVVVFSKADEERLKADAKRLVRVDGLKQCDKAARKIAGQPDQPAEPDKPVEPAAEAKQPEQSAEPEPEPEPYPDESHSELHDYSVAELRDMARARGLEMPDGYVRKDDLIAMLEGGASAAD